ncbi:3-hydroxyacyl-CoA dehydrogenase [Paucilactobacillus kaifaensis]|uniref:3-hydroxyacyl-CoA dehydrogenase n=1 Tax=Paucilactobacillus kaifaensis TaxID=2559921 RepID=UPI0014854BB0|nr:3-hydroxyacyl-CoA dehydrogenase [Paucilactobacillus kaifaensis]
MKINKVVVLGGGVLGSQIAFQTAYSGFDVVLYDISDAALKGANQKLSSLPAQYQRDLNATQEQLNAVNRHLSLTTDLKKAVSDASIIVEAIPEQLSIKESMYQKLAPFVSDNTLLLSNSSTLLPSQMISFAPNKNRFLAMHFANLIWIHNAAEIMWAPGTPQTAIDDAVDFAKSIHMVPFAIPTEISGYIMNAVFLPMLNAALFLWVEHDLDPIMIDQDWMVGMGLSRGPFGFMDIMGINTAINIEGSLYKEIGDERYKKIVDKLTNDYLKQGKMGVPSGEGFYHYPNPLYQQPEFTKA